MTRYLADDHPEWRHPADDPPPLGTKLHILTLGGVAVHGQWNPDEGALLWAPLPRLTPEMKARLRAEGHNV